MKGIIDWAGCDYRLGIEEFRENVWGNIRFEFEDVARTMKLAAENEPKLKPREHEPWMANEILGNGSKKANEIERPRCHPPQS